MIGDIIKIPKVEVSPSADTKVINALEHYIYKYKNSDNENRLRTVTELRDIIKSENIIGETQLYDRTKMFSQLVGNYYKVHLKSYPYVYYVFVYNLIKENDTLWMLYCTGNDDVYHGVVNGNKCVTDEWNINLEFEEISKQEFIDFIENKNKLIYDTLYKKLHTYNHYNIKWTTNDKFEYDDKW